MKRLFVCSAIALPFALGSVPAEAQDAREGSEPQESAPIVVSYEPLHAAAGVMNDHMHDSGELMLGLRYLHESSRGANRAGTRTISDADILASGYVSRASQMEMDMVMLDIMYAPNDNLTFMVMPQWMRHEMTMVGINSANTGMDMMGGMDMSAGHHSLAFGQKMTHSTQGLADTLVSGSLRLARSHGLNAHATLGLWLPTGKADRKNSDGTFVHYGMQSGSGTWDIEPSLTLSGTSGSFGWGAQGSYRWRSEERNKSGFSFGDKAKFTAWASKLISPRASVTGRISWEHEGQVQGHYNAGHNHSAPADRQPNYGGDIVWAATGINIALPLSGAKPPQLGIEASMPIHQNLHGIQLPRDWRLALSLTKSY